MLRRHSALKFALLTTAVALILLCLVALACAPAAPSGQDSTGGAGAEAEAAPVLPTNTNTLEPTPSPTPPVTPDLAKLGVDTEAIIAFLAVPTPDAGLSDDAAINGVAASALNTPANGTGNRRRFRCRRHDRR